MAENDSISALSSLEPNDVGTCFVLLVSKDKAATRDGKPFYRVAFRDRSRTATVMVWSDSTWFDNCDQIWQPGGYYKIRCLYQETQYGSQLELEQIREVNDEDLNEGFNPVDFHSASRFDIEEMFAELCALAEEHLSEDCLKQLTLGLLNDFEDTIKTLPAATRNHHAFSGGFLEHVLSVTRTAVFLADKYRDYYPHMQPPLSKSLVVAGAILHDIGKVQELSYQPQGASYTAEGQLIGHILLGRDIVREKAATIDSMDRELQLRLEHIIVSHQNIPEWGSPVSPHTPEALLVYFPDDVDAKFHMMATALEREPADGETFTSRDNALRRAFFRGFGQ
jgi:3'-5' exoribonuclease